MLAILTIQLQEVTHMGITADSGGVRSVERALAIVDLLGEHQALGWKNCIT